MLDLSKHAAMLEGGGRGPAVVPGKRCQLADSTGRQDQKPFMPPRRRPPLSPEELAILKSGFDQGAKPGSGSLRKFESP